MAWGIEWTVFFCDDRDCGIFVAWLGRLAEASAGTVDAWALVGSRAGVGGSGGAPPRARGLRDR